MPIKNSKAYGFTIVAYVILTGLSSKMNENKALWIYVALVGSNSCVAIAVPTTNEIVEIILKISTPKENWRTNFASVKYPIGIVCNQFKPLFKSEKVRFFAFSTTAASSNQRLYLILKK